MSRSSRESTPDSGRWLWTHPFWELTQKRPWMASERRPRIAGPEAASARGPLPGARSTAPFIAGPCREARVACPARSASTTHSPPGEQPRQRNQHEAGHTPAQVADHEAAADRGAEALRDPDEPDECHD